MPLASASLDENINRIFIFLSLADVACPLASFSDDKLD